MFKKLATGAAAIALVASQGAMAQVSSSAQSLSIARAAPQARAGAELSRENKQVAGAGLYLLGAIGLGLLIWGVIELTEDDDEDTDSI